MNSFKTKNDNVNVRDIQLKILTILEEIDRICVKNEIEYSLAFGSLLGAVRHQGYIPWDDDLDIMMDYKNYDKFLEVLKTDLNSNFYFHAFETDNRYNVTIPNMKIRLKGTKIIETNKLLKNRCDGDGLFVDVFVFDSISDSKFNHFLHRLAACPLIFSIILLDNLGFNPVCLKKRLTNFSRNYAKKNKDSKHMYLTLSWIYEGLKDKRVLKTDYNPMVLVTFENKKYPVANNYHHLLEVEYGDYMKLPPEKAQVAKHTDLVFLNYDENEN